MKSIVSIYERKEILIVNKEESSKVPNKCFFLFEF